MRPNALKARTTRTTLGLLFVAASLQLRCATTRPSTVAETDLATAGSTPKSPTGDKPTEATAAAPAQAPSRPPGTIYRREIEEFLAQPPALFLQRVESEPFFVKGRFHGWRVTSFYAGDPRFDGIALRAGDVVSRINGMPIERPEQFIAAWNAMKAATVREISLELERDGAPRTVSWKILEN